ncbi:hypothetical protein SAMN05660748_1658 [Blastococcus aggregatus]|uniref:Copper(I)-binding protein n=1 Tax=Blastococcus aggregatus TaxID=38502 RepID=A0A285V472_9ACTN|nr:copper chaperone PCu(A)C [Blastococcus aggregatus]SOC48945.1 hypothetical protein SAMN05660748_1658 [Blastococcus aggregatus]
MTSSSRSRRPVVQLAVGGMALALALVGCGADTATKDPSAPAAQADAATPEVSVALADGWVKAADTGMTGVFGTLTNRGDEDVTLVAASSPVARTVEMHETVMGADGAMVMQEKAGGIVVPAGGEYELRPGGDHIMLLGLDAPVTVGDDVTVTFETAGGGTIEITANGREFSGAEESYTPGNGAEDDG